MINKILLFISIMVLIVIPLYPKFPLISVPLTFVSIRIEDFIIGVVFLFTLLAILVKKENVLQNEIVKYIVVFLIIGAMSTFLGIVLTKTVDPGLGVLHFLRRVQYMFMFILGLMSISNIKESINNIVKVLLLVGLTVSIYGLGQQFYKFPVVSTTNSEFSKGLTLTLGEGARINSTFAGHYDLAAFLILPITICITLIPLSSPKQKIAVILIAIISYLALLYSASRVTYASIVVLSLLTTLIIKRKKYIPAILLLSALGIIISPQLRGRYLELIQNHILSSVSVAKAQENMNPRDSISTPDSLKEPAKPEDRSFNIRIQASWPKAIRAVSLNPIFGTGFSSVGLAIDNNYLRKVSEVGILGFVSFIMIITKLMWNLKNSLISYKNDIKHAFVVSVAIYWIGLMINALFIDIFLASKIAIISWLLAGMAVKVANEKNI